MRGLAWNFHIPRQSQPFQGSLVANYDLIHRFKAGNLDKKLLDFEPPIVRMQFEVDTKDKNNPRLFAVIQDDIWAPQCAKAQKKIDKTVQKFCTQCAARIKDEEDPAIIDEWVTAYIREFNDAIDSLLRRWKQKVEKAIDDQLKDWNRTNRDAVKIKVKKGLKVVLPAAKAAKNLTQIILSGGADVEAWVSFANNLRKLAKAISAATKSLDKRWKELVKKIITLQSELDTLEEARESGGMTRRVATLAAHISDPVKNVHSALGEFKDEIRLIESSLKKTGKHLQEILNRDLSGLSRDKRKQVQSEIQGALDNIDELNSHVNAARGFANSVQTEVLDVAAERLSAMGIRRLAQKYAKKVGQATTAARGVASAARTIGRIVEY